MKYTIFSIDGKEKKRLLWGTFSENKKKMFLFVSYLMNGNSIDDFYIIEEETGKIVKLSVFADHHKITKEDIKHYKP